MAGCFPLLTDCLSGCCDCDCDWALSRMSQEETLRMRRVSDAMAGENGGRGKQKPVGNRSDAKSERMKRRSKRAQEKV